MGKRVVLLSVSSAILALVFWSWGVSDDFDPASLRGKVVLITGASTGIGEQLAYQYAQAGAALLLTARREGVLLQVAVRCRQLGSPRAEVVAGDMGDAGHRREVVLRAQRLFGRLDLLVLNHMLNNPRFWLGAEADLAELELFLEVNLVAYVDLASRALELLDRSHGAIAVLSSSAGRIGWPTMIAYSAAKFALEGFFAGLRQELVFRERNVSVTMCVLGLVATDNVLGFVRERYARGADVAGIIVQPNDTAAAIVRGVALKKPVLYHPQSLYWMFLGHAVFPGIFEAFVRQETCGRFGYSG